MYLKLTVPHLLALGFRSNMSDADLSDILPEDVEEEVKTAAEISMGTEVWMKQCAYLCIRISPGYVFLDKGVKPSIHPPLHCALSIVGCAVTKRLTRTNRFGGKANAQGSDLRPAMP